MVLMASALAQAPAQAVHDVGCGGAWTASAWCGFQPSGLPLTIFAESEVGSGIATLHVRISKATIAGEVVVFECSATGAGTSTPKYATCGDTLGPDQGLYVQTVPLECIVSGRGSGAYFCGNPCPRPPPAPCF